MTARRLRCPSCSCVIDPAVDFELVPVTDAERRAAREQWAREHTCPSCGELDELELLPVAAPGPVAARARLCTLCRAHAERILLDAETVDGRPRRELVTAYLERIDEP